MRPLESYRRVIGLGNAWRGDDAAGLACLAALRGRVPADVALIDSDGDPAALLEQLSGAALVYLIDACRSGDLPGTVHRVDVAHHPLCLPNGATSSHGLGLATALELARTFGQVPAQCQVFAIEAGDFTLGAPLCGAVRTAVERVAQEIQCQLSPPRPARSGSEVSSPACGAQPGRTPWSR